MCILFNDINLFFHEQPNMLPTADCGFGITLHQFIIYLTQLKYLPENFRDRKCERDICIYIICMCVCTPYGHLFLIKERVIISPFAPESLAIDFATVSVQYNHCNDVTMSSIASQITSLTVVYSTVYSDADQRKHQSFASLAFVWGIHRDRWIPRTQGQLRGKMFPLYDVIMTPPYCHDEVWTWKSFQCFWSFVHGHHRWSGDPLTEAQ